MRLTTPEISWHGKEPLFSLDFSSNNKSTRLATSAADSNIRIWAVETDADKGSKVDFIANLSRHTKAVNVVRFSPQGNMLASGGDDCYVIIWKLNDDDIDLAASQLGNMDSVDIENKESWKVAKMLRGHIEDVYDLAWSPNATQLISGSVDNSAIIWDINTGNKLKILKDHRQYVQGVSWDPCGVFVATYSCDRTCRIYNTSSYRCCYNINKMAIPKSSEQGNQGSKQIKIFHDETMPSFFRRLTFSPDGQLLLVPGGKFKVNEKAINTTFVFTKATINKPVMYFPATKKATIAVKCCPVLFELRNTDKSSGENVKSIFKLPYRMVIAVASLDCVVLYDTQRSLPFGFLSNMHYASLTDIAWSSDGKILAISSRDGYCSLVTFDDNELGVPYSQTAREVIQSAQKESSPIRRNVVTPRSKTPDSTLKDERISPKIEKLSIKNFVTVNPPKQNCQTSSGQTTVQTSSGGNSGQRTSVPGPRRVGFVTVQPSSEKNPVIQQRLNSTSTPSISTSTVTGPAVAVATVSTATQSRRVNFTTLQPGKSSSTVPPRTASNTQSLSTNSSNEANTQSSLPTSGTTQPDAASTQQPRRVGFVTLQSSQSTSENLAKTQPSNVISNTAKTLPSTAEEIKPDNVASAQQPRRVGFVTLDASQSPTIPQQSLPANPTPTSNTNQNELHPLIAREGCTPSTQPPPRRVNFVSIHPPQTSSEANQGQKIPLSSETPGPSTSKETSPNTLARQKRPVPLEPEIIIVND